MTVLKSTSAPRWRVYGLYVVMALLTLMFAFSAIGKLTASQQMVDNFARWGYPGWFMYVTGLIELVAVVLMWIPRTRLWGALALVAVMLGAIATHVLSAEWFMLPMVTVLLLLSGLVAYANRPAR